MRYLIGVQVLRDPGSGAPHRRRENRAVHPAAVCLQQRALDLWARTPM